MRLSEAATQRLVAIRRRGVQRSAADLGEMYRAVADGIESIERAYRQPMVVGPLLDCLESDREEPLAFALRRAADTVERREWI